MEKINYQDYYHKRVNIIERDGSTYRNVYIGNIIFYHHNQILVSNKNVHHQSSIIKIEETLN